MHVLRKFTCKGAASRRCSSCWARRPEDLDLLLTGGRLREKAREVVEKQVGNGNQEAILLSSRFNTLGEPSGRAKEEVFAPWKEANVSQKG